MIPALEAISTAHLAPDLGHKLFECCNDAIRFLDEQGCQVEVSHDLRDLADFWTDHSGGEDLFMVPNFNPDFWPNCGPDDTLLVFLRKGNKLVGVYGHRLMVLDHPRRMHSMTLKQAFNSLHYFYEDPASMAPANETCVSKTSIAHMIMYGPICIAGALWLEKPLRGNDLFKSAFSSLSRTLCLLARNWRWSWMVGVFCERNRDLAIDHFGFQNYHPNALSYRGENWWLCTSSRADAVRIAIDPEDR